MTAIGRQIAKCRVARVAQVAQVLKCQVGRREVTRAAAASVQGALSALDRLDERVFPVAVQIMDAVGTRVSRIRHAFAVRMDRRVVRPDDARRGMDGTLLERGMRIMVLGAVGMIGVSAVAGLVRGPAAGRPEGRAGPSGRPPAGAQADPSGTALATPVQTAPRPQTVQVGPSPDEPIDGYLTVARMRLAALAQAADQPDTYAVVSFPGYRTPEQTLGLLQDFRTVRVFFRVPPDGPTLSADILDPAADVRAAFEQAGDAAARRADAATDSDTRQLAADEAAALRDSCACLYGAVVRAPVERLVILAGMTSVRLVDAAPPGTAGSVGSVVFTPLRPEQL